MNNTYFSKNDVMFKLKQDNSNTVVLTITEKYSGSASTPTYKCKLVNDMTNDEKEFTIENLSEDTERYDKFLITLVDSDSENLSNAFIYLQDNGFYTYYIFEESDEDTILESGKCYVYTGTEITTDTDNIFYNNDNNNVITYE